MIKSINEELIINGTANEIITDFMLIASSIVNDLQIFSKEDMIRFVDAACEIEEEHIKKKGM